MLQNYSLDFTPFQIGDVRTLSSASLSICLKSFPETVKNAVFASKCGLENTSIFPITARELSLDNSPKGILKTEAQPDDMGAMTLSYSVFLKLNICKSAEI